MWHTVAASASLTTSLRSLTSYPSAGCPPIHMPFFLEAAILSRIRSPVTSRSNWAKESSTLSVRRPILLVVLNACVTDTNDALRVEDLDDLGEISQRSRQSVDVDDDYVDLVGTNVVQELLQRRAIHRASGIGSIIVERGENRPTFVLLARDVGLAGFALCIERIELLLEALLRRFAGVDGAADLRARRGTHLTEFNHLRSPNASPRRSRDCRASLLQSPTFSSARRSGVRTIGHR